MKLKYSTLLKVLLVASVVSVAGSLGSCAMVDVPGARNATVPTPTLPNARTRGINEMPDSVMYLPLGDDILVPEIAQDDPLPYEIIGPFELRNETLAGALQLILADYDIGLAFETNAAMEQRITVANMSGELGKVVRRVCSLANLYCSFEDGTLVVKDTQTFTVTLPPIGTAAANTSSSSTAGGTGGITQEGDYLTNVSAGLAAILGTTPIVDTATRTIVYTASQRTASMADRYFQRLRANTAMIVYETYIWEVQLTAGNSAGIDWSGLDKIGKFSISAAVNGAVASDFTNPISIGLPTTGNVTPSDLFSFLSQFGAVKTISQPQVTVLSGSSAQMRVADTRNYVSEITSTIVDQQTTFSVSTDSVDSGFTLTIGSSWDKATVYTSVSVEITDVLDIDDFSVTGSGTDAETTRIQLPQTTERELHTQIRVRPGDSVLIGGLVRERDNFDKAGLGFMEPIVPQSRTAQSQNLELVIMMRPRVVVYTDAGDLRYVDYVQRKSGIADAPPIAATGLDESAAYSVTRPSVEAYQLPSGGIAPVSATPVAADVPVALDAPPAPIVASPAYVDPVGHVTTAPPPRLSDTPSSAYRPSAAGRRSSASVPASPSVDVAPFSDSSYSDDYGVLGASAAPRNDYVSPYETYEYYGPR